MKKILSIILTIIMCAALLSGCGSDKEKKETDPDKKATEEVTETTASEFSDKADEEQGYVTVETLPEDLLSEEEQAAFDEILMTMILDYGYYPDEAWPYVENHLEELKEISEGRGHRWELIMDYWRYTREELTVSYDGLPADIEDSSEVCLAVLGYKLYDDGKIRPELEQRLKLALKCAEDNPHIQIICAGGGTARMNTQATEAGQMAEWLIENGIEENRIMVEDGSKTTGQNAMFSYEI
ncbi:MAG: YdcF family protein, partial [Parasporobacterium sp.]|nr:YdcF family protein [Parasporobacterium sp.]